MSLFNQHDIWPIARFNNYKFGILCTSIITLFSILGFLYLNGDNLNLNSKVIVAVSQNDAHKNINSIVNILEKNRINYGYKIIPEAEISELLIGLENTASITKYLFNKDNYTFPVFIEFNYKAYYKFDIDNIFKDITFNMYIVDNSLSVINILIYVAYFIFLILALALSNIFFLKLDKNYIQVMSYYGANRSLLMRLLFRRIIFNSILGFILGWLIIFILLNILNLTNAIALNTIDFINLKNNNSYFYFLTLIVTILYSQYIVVLMMLKKYMRIKIE
jgi:hypothetical protein|tara:strand:+ start:1448 stop:2278 length:831 start_codon:yes stop_codon:yes gene_type:complete